jgi:hypothetical protein
MRDERCPSGADGGDRGARLVEEASVRARCRVHSGLRRMRGVVG